MLVFETTESLRRHLSAIRKPGSTTGFVPTMGALHDGHLSLVSQSLSENDVTVVSIFVNPTQFNNPDDLAKYPRTLDADVARLTTRDDSVIVFSPSVDDIYNGETVSRHFEFDGLENQMEGRFRPGHFDGVGTIVKALFEIVEPTNAYFGEKDFQQLQIVKKMTEKERLPVKIKGMPVFREANGLAMSSRNARLSDDEKRRSSIIYRTLKKAKKMFASKSASAVTAEVTTDFRSQSGMELEYFEIADEATLEHCFRKSPKKKYRAFIAVFVGDVRLIDTIALY